MVNRLAVDDLVELMNRMNTDTDRTDDDSHEPLVDIAFLTRRLGGNDNRITPIRLASRLTLFSLLWLKINKL